MGKVPLYSPNVVSNRRQPLVVLLTLIVIIALIILPRPEITSNALQRFSASKGLKTVERLSRIDTWRGDAGRKRKREDFWKSLASCLQEARPKISPPQHGKVDKEWIGKTGGPGYKAEMPTSDIQSMHQSHEQYEKCIATLSLDSTYLPQERGIVTTAGGNYIPIFLVSLRLLRRTGTQLPIEVFLANEAEYESYFCETILPSLNAKCRILSKELGAVANFTIESYQFKILSVLFSSFEDVLFMDADNLALMDPTPYFDSKLYRHYGMVLWPDFWMETSSDLFYEIQGKPKSSTKASVRTCETGQILVSKRQRSTALLLATMYNVFGPHYYYSLLSQGSPGEGDKETFQAAATYLDEPFYRVERRVEPLGYFDKEGNHDFHGQAMLQFSPLDDYAKVSERAIRPAFIHANYPKFDPYTILNKGITNYKDSQSHRIWYDLHKKGYEIAWGGSDPEPQVWQEMIYVACNYKDKFRYTGEKGKDHCENLQSHYKSLFQSNSTL